mgnify:CR=1 FL=1
MSPFESKSQMRFMYAKHPKIAKRWSKKYEADEDMPEKKNLNELIKKGRKTGKKSGMHKMPGGYMMKGKM